MSNKVIVITGATSGIGRSIAEAFAKDDNKVAIFARNIDKGNQIADELSSKGNCVVKFFKVDVSIEEDIKTAYRSIMEEWGQVDILVNNAGIAEAPAPIHLLEVDSWDAVFNTNLKGAWLNIKYAAHSMMEARQGRIINISSVYGKVATAMGITAYTASKHGLNGLTKASALELAPYGITVNSVCPGWVETPANEAALANQDIRTMAESLHPMGRLCSKEDVVNAIAWLAEDTTRFVTGQEIAVDGGYLAQ